MTDNSPQLENSGNQLSNKQTSLDRREKLRHLLVGNPAVVKQAIHRLHGLGYAEVREWSRPISAAGSLGEPGEVVSILIKQVVSDT
jgi:hypothetical protein